MESERVVDTSFDWRIYQDATFAGLSILIPIPLVDLAFEQLFRRRMVQTIARRNGVQLSRMTQTELNRSGFSVAGCALLPFKLIWKLIVRFYRTVLYLLTINEAVTLLSTYWGRAFLLNYIFQNQILASSRTPLVAAVVDATLDAEVVSPLNQLAQQVTRHTRNITRTVWGWARGQQDDAVVRETQQEMAQQWAGLDSYFRLLAARFEAELAEREVAAQIKVGRR